MSFVLLFSKRKEWKRLENTGNMLRNYYIIILLLLWQNKRLDAQSKNKKTLAGRQTVTSRSID